MSVSLDGVDRRIVKGPSTSLGRTGWALLDFVVPSVSRDSFHYFPEHFL